MPATCAEKLRSVKLTLAQNEMTRRSDYTCAHPPSFAASRSWEYSLCGFVWFVICLGVSCSVFNGPLCQKAGHISDFRDQWPQGLLCLLFVLVMNHNATFTLRQLHNNELPAATPVACTFFQSKSNQSTLDSKFLPVANSLAFTRPPPCFLRSVCPHESLRQQGFPLAPPPPQPARRP